MSFRCARCKVAFDGTTEKLDPRPVRVVAAYRRKSYDSHGVQRDGYEIASEKLVCKGCVPHVEAKLPAREQEHAASV